jgi:hypothetical protein
MTMQITAEIWIDHRKAVITTVSEEGQTTSEVCTNMDSGFEQSKRVHPTESREHGLTAPADKAMGESMKHLNQYYLEVIAAIGDAMTVLIFGPGETKIELGRQLQLVPVEIRIHSMGGRGELTERQIADRARDHFYN